MQTDTNKLRAEMTAAYAAALANPEMIGAYEKARAAYLKACGPNLAQRKRAAKLSRSR